VFGALDGREDGVSDVPRGAAASVMCCDSSERRHKVSVVIRKAQSHQNQNQALSSEPPKPDPSDSELVSSSESES